MTTETTVAKQLACPSCHKKAKRVSTVTMGALLDDQIAKPFKEDGYLRRDSKEQGCKPISGHTGWQFCDSTNCDVVYFREEGDTTFTKSQLKVPVGVKETAGERPLCYCFGYSVASIKEELRTTGHSDALEDIRAKMNTPGCQCETKNPSGACCLGSVARGIKIAQQELAMSDMDTQSPPATARPFASKGEKIARIGTLVSAIMASSCCWLPLILLAVGVSGAGIARALEAYRPLFMVVTFGFLGAAFYFTYRPKKVVTSEGHDCCAPKSKARFLITLNKAMLWVVSAIAVAFLFFPSYVGELFGHSDGKTVTDDMNRAVIHVDGMTCEGCAAIVADIIRKVPGVQAVEVDYKTREAVVGAEICCPVPTQAILNALQEAGYTGRAVKVDTSQTENSISFDQERFPLVDLSADVREFRQAFNDSKGDVRVVLLISPG